MLKRFNTEISHKPSNRYKGQWIGVEIECFMPYRSLGIKNEYDGYKWRNAKKKLGALIKKAGIPHVTLKSDGSINADSDYDDDFFEIEINLLFTRKNYAPLKKLCDLLKKLKARTNDSCGLHVHLDCRDVCAGLDVTYESNMYGYRKAKYSGKGFDKLMKRGTRLEKVLPMMLKIVDESRIDNEYCDAELGDISGGRTAINMGAFNEHKTIEVRLHEGTVKYDKIKNWIEFLYFVTRNKIESTIETPRDLKREIPRTPQKIINYIRKSIAA